MEEIITRFIDMPTGTYGFVIEDPDGDFNVYINARMTSEKRVETYKHELEHIRRGDFYRSGSADLIEIHAHGKDGSDDLSNCF